jgi:hypothetical protein
MPNGCQIKGRQIGKPYFFTHATSLLVPNIETYPSD